MYLNHRIHTLLTRRIRVGYPVVVIDVHHPTRFHLLRHRLVYGKRHPLRRIILQRILLKGPLKAINLQSIPLDYKSLRYPVIKVDLPKCHRLGIVLISPHLSKGDLYPAVDLAMSKTLLLRLIILDHLWLKEAKQIAQVSVEFLLDHQPYLIGNLIPKVV